MRRGRKRTERLQIGISSPRQLYVLQEMIFNIKMCCRLFDSSKSNLVNFIQHLDTQYRLRNRIPL